MLLVHNTTYKRQNIIVCYKETTSCIHAAAACCCYVATALSVVTFTLSHAPLRGEQLATGICAVLATDNSQQEKNPSRSHLQKGTLHAGVWSA